MSDHEALELLPSDQRRLRIGGQWRDSSDGATFTVDDPADTSTICEVADATPADATAALDAAVAAQE